MKFKGFMKRHKNRIMCLISSFVLFCGFVFSSPLKANAAPSVITRYLRIEEPLTTRHNGYMIIAVEGGDAHVITWYCKPIAGENQEQYNVNLQLTSGKLRILAGSPNDYYVRVAKYQTSDNLEYMYFNAQCEGGTSQLIEVDFSGTVSGYTAKGDYTQIDDLLNWSNHIPVSASWGNMYSLAEQDYLAMIYNQLLNESASDSHTRAILNDIVAELNQTQGLQLSTNQYIEKLLSEVEKQLPQLYDKLDEILEEEKKQTSWLEKIWNSIQEFFTPDDKDKETTDKLEEDSKEQSNQLNELNKQNQTEKLDPSASSSSVDANVDTNSMLNYGVVLQIFTNHGYILKCMLLVVSIGLVAYVLFGKKK